MVDLYLHTKNPRVIGPIGRCIYGENHSTLNLSREHVIPVGLGGGIILRGASCPDCRRITAGFEATCLQDNWGMHRAHVRMPTRRPKKRPTHAKILVIENGREEPKVVPLSEHPHALLMPEFDGLPAAISGSDIPLKIKMLAISNRAELQRRSAIHTTGSVAVDVRYDIPAVLRLLAKIAHGVMFAAYDTSHIRPLLLNIILKGDVGNAWHLIGNAEPLEPALPSGAISGLHKIRLQVARMVSGSFRIIVSIRLFAEFGAPTYAVVAGEADVNPVEL